MLWLDCTPDIVFLSINAMEVNECGDYEGIHHVVYDDSVSRMFDTLT